MNQTHEQNQKSPEISAQSATNAVAGLKELEDRKLYPTAPLRQEIYYPVPTEDEMGETAIHYKQTQLIFALLENFFARRNDVLVTANMAVYYEETELARWYAPDVFVGFGADKTERRVFKIWEEGFFPQVVFEVASEATIESDLGKKYLEYDRLGAEEYYLLDPGREYLPQPLMAFQRSNGGRLCSVKVADERVYSKRLGLEIVDTGKLFRLFDNTKQEFLLTLEEAEIGLQLFETKFEQAEEERLKTEAENSRLQTEIARLRELLNQKQ